MVVGLKMIALNEGEESELFDARVGTSRLRAI